MSHPIQIIKEDHEIIRNLFTTYNGYTEHDDEMKKETAHEILKELSVHARMEEKFFYPRLKEAMDNDHPLPVDDAIAEHHAAKMLMLELKVIPVSSETYDAKMNVLEENVMHHMEEEETELLPQAEAVLAGDVEEIGKSMEDYRRSAHKDILEKLLG